MIAVDLQERRKPVNAKARAEIARLQNLLGACLEWSEKRIITLKLAELINLVRE